MRDSFEKHYIVWFPDSGRWASSQKLGNSRRCWLCKYNGFYWGSLTGFSCTVMLSSPSQFSKHQPKRGKSVFGSFVSSSNGYLLSFPKMEKPWTEIPVLFNYLKAPRSHFLSRITLAHRFCKLITSWTCGLFASCPPDNNPRSQVLAWYKVSCKTKFVSFQWQKFSKGQVAFSY